jgi:hypothetical protein
VTRAGEEDLPKRSTRLGDILEQVRVQVDIDPGSTYATLDIRSFGKGIFHYDPRPGAEIGKLRFFEADQTSSRSATSRLGRGRWP